MTDPTPQPTSGDDLIPVDIAVEAIVPPVNLVPEPADRGHWWVPAEEYGRLVAAAEALGAVTQERDTLRAVVHEMTLGDNVDPDYQMQEFGWSRAEAEAIAAARAALGDTP